VRRLGRQEEVPHQSPDIRVVVCDCHALFRRGVVMELDDAGDIEVIGEAADGRDAVDICSHLAPDVVLMDVSMPSIDGIETTRRLGATIPSAKVLMLTSSHDEQHLFEAIRAGATGYLLKESTIAEVAPIVRAVAAGESFVSPVLAGRLLAEFCSLSERAESSWGIAAALTEREVEILERMSSGADNASIATALDLTQSSVKNHVGNVLAKLQLHTRTEAVLFAVREGLVDS